MTAPSKEKIYDLIMAAPVILWFALGAAGAGMKGLEWLGAGETGLRIAVQFGNLVFLSLAIALLVLRRPPVKKAKGPGPVLAGVIGCLAPFLAVLMPRNSLSENAANLLAAVGLSGVIGSIYVMSWLGRSFSILPQARGLVTGGPYRFVRHPLYLAEFLMVIAKAFELAQPWPFLILAIAAASQVARMHYEEQVLTEAFPGYREYARHKARLIPGVY